MREEESLQFATLLELEFWWAQRSGSCTVFDDTHSSYRGECLIRFLRRSSCPEEHLRNTRVEPVGLGHECRLCRKIHD